jgi:hypothetical protein
MFGIFANWGPADSGDYPDVTNTLADDTTDNAAGTYEAAGESDVALGVDYGAGGDEFTGTGSEFGIGGIFFLRRK